MSRQRPSNVPAARSALVRFQRQMLKKLAFLIKQMKRIDLNNFDATCTLSGALRRFLPSEFKAEFRPAHQSFFREELQRTENPSRAKQFQSSKRNFVPQSSTSLGRKRPATKQGRTLARSEPSNFRVQSGTPSRRVQHPSGASALRPSKEELWLAQSQIARRVKHLDI